MVESADVYFLLVGCTLSGESWNAALRQEYGFNGRNCSTTEDVGNVAKWSQGGLPALCYPPAPDLLWLEQGLVELCLHVSYQLLGEVLIAKISTATVSNHFFLPLLLCFFCRPCEVGSSLCHVSEGCDKNCQQREAQRVGANEGNFLMGVLKNPEILALCLLFHAKLISLITYNKHPCQYWDYLEHNNNKLVMGEARAAEMKWECACAL